MSVLTVSESGPTWDLAAETNGGTLIGFCKSAKWMSPWGNDV